MQKSCTLYTMQLNIMNFTSDARGPCPRDTRDWQHACCQGILSQTGEGHRLTVQNLAHVVTRRNQSDRCPERAARMMNSRDLTNGQGRGLAY